MSGGGSGKIQETSLDKALADIGVDRYENYKQTFQPLEKQAVNDVVSNQQADAQQARNVASANYQQQFGLQRSPVAMGLGNRTGGGSGAMVSGIGASNTNQGSASGLGMADTNLASNAKYTNNLSSLINIGQGKAGQALTGLAGATSASDQQSIIDARASAAASNAYKTALGTGAGLAVGTYGSGGVGSYGTNGLKGSGF